MTDIITDEMVEVAAKARWDYERAESGDTTEWDMRYPAFREFDTDAMRAALETVAPLIAAQALEDAAEAWGAGEWQEAWLADAVEDDVSAVRSTVTWLRARADRIEQGDQP